jgi:hypothetical protein
MTGYAAINMRVCRCCTAAGAIGRERVEEYLDLGRGHDKSRTPREGTDFRVCASPALAGPPARGPALRGRVVVTPGPAGPAVAIVEDGSGPVTSMPADRCGPAFGGGGGEATGAGGDATTGAGTEDGAGPTEISGAGCQRSAGLEFVAARARRPTRRRMAPRGRASHRRHWRVGSGSTASSAAPRSSSARGTASASMQRISPSCARRPMTRTAARTDLGAFARAVGYLRGPLP